MNNINEFENLCDIDYKIWKKLDADCGAHIEKKWPEYLTLVNEAVQTPVSKEMIDALEDENHHSFIQALEELNKIK